MKQLFKFISIIFHPLLITIQVLLLLYFTNRYLFGSEYESKNILLLFLMTFFYPMLVILLMKPIGFISSYEMKDRKERIGPLMAAIVFYVWTFMSVKATGFPMIFQAFVLGVVFALSLAFIINNFHKISLHMIGMGGAFFEFLTWVSSSQYDYSYLLLVLIIIIGLVATARLYLKSHTYTELYTGFLTGIIGQMVATIILF